MRHCLYCGKELIGHNGNSRYCNRDCKYALIKSKHILKKRKCLYCQKELIGYHDHSRYCDNVCKNAFLKAKYVSEKKQINKTCIVCGNEFIAEHPSAKYCSVKCASKYYRTINPIGQKKYEENRKEKRKEYMKEYNARPYVIAKPKRKIISQKIDITCIVCGKIFKDNKNIKLCSKECRNKTRAKICRICGKQFINKKHEYKAFYCSQQCKKIGYGFCGKIANQRRKAREKKVEHSLIIKQWRGALLYFNNKCAYCGSNGNGKPLHQDHVIPLSKGGEYSQNNIIPACFDCNISKSNSDMHTWYRAQPFYSQFREKKINNRLGYYNSYVQQLVINI